MRGYALAGGFGLACACDLVVAADDAVFGTPEINVGLWPYMITVPLLRSMPPKTALDLMMTGRRVSAEEGARIGFVQRVVPVAELDATVDALAAELASKSPLIMHWGRDAFYRVLEMDADAALVVSPGDVDRHDADRGRGRRCRRLRREACAAMEGTLMAKPISTAGGDVHDWGPLVGDLAKRRERALEMGGADRVVRQRELGKLTVRERLDLLLDPGTWVEYGLLADHMDAGLGDRYLAADGAITGVGEIDGRPVAVAAYDFTVMAGSMGAVGENKIARAARARGAQRMPFVWLLDSAGARIQSTSGSTFAGAGALFREQVAMSGVVPMVAAMLGHCAAGHRVHPRRSPTSSRW